MNESKEILNEVARQLFDSRKEIRATMDAFEEFLRRMEESEKCLQEYNRLAARFEKELQEALEREE